MVWRPVFLGYSLGPSTDSCGQHKLTFFLTLQQSFTRLTPGSMHFYLLCCNGRHAVALFFPWALPLFDNLAAIITASRSTLIAPLYGVLQYKPNIMRNTILFYCVNSNINYNFYLQNPKILSLCRHASSVFPKKDYVIHSLFTRLEHYGIEISLSSYHC